MSPQIWNANFIALSPMFGPFLQFKEYIENMQKWPTYGDFNHLNVLKGYEMRTQSGKSICFVPPHASKAGAEERYETKIYLTGEIPTRFSNWHDFFNALVWRVFPTTKSVLNYLHFHAQQMESAHNSKQRGPLRDAATIFDESGVVVVSSSVKLINMLKEFCWEELFWHERSAVLSEMRFYIFGHGLYEKALNPYIGMTGKGMCFHVPGGFFEQAVPEQLAAVDVMLRLHLLESFSSNADLTPVPLLGYPGWDKNNNDKAYYRNKNYFRSRPA
ncbi:MAG: DUF3025 domain-containing protein [Pseudomonadota bacterium]